RGGSFCGNCPVVTYRNEYSYPAPQQISHERRITIKVALRRAELDCHVLALDIAGFFQAGIKGRDLRAARLLAGRHESDPRQRGLLCVRSKWPCCPPAISAMKCRRFIPRFPRPGREPRRLKFSTVLERVPCHASQHDRRAEVAFGSLAEVDRSAVHVRSPPESGPG